MNTYDEGQRDAKIERLQKDVDVLFDEMRMVRGWQNRAIGYVSAITLLASLLIQLGLKKLGG